MNRRSFFRSLAAAGLAACARVWPAAPKTEIVMATDVYVSMRNARILEYASLFRDRSAP